MKNNGSMEGSGGASGNSGLAGEAYAPLGQYFVKFVQAYSAQGISVRAITPQNEPLNGTSNYPGMDLNVARRSVREHDRSGHRLDLQLGSRGLAVEHGTR